MTFTIGSQPPGLRHADDRAGIRQLRHHGADSHFTAGGKQLWIPA